MANNKLIPPDWYYDQKGNLVHVVDAEGNIRGSTLTWIAPEGAAVLSSSDTKELSKQDIITNPKYNTYLDNDDLLSLLYSLPPYSIEQEYLELNPKPEDKIYWLEAITWLAKKTRWVLTVGISGEIRVGIALAGANLMGGAYFAVDPDGNYAFVFTGSAFATVLNYGASVSDEYRDKPGLFNDGSNYTGLDIGISADLAIRWGEYGHVSGLAGTEENFDVDGIKAFDASVIYDRDVIFKKVTGLELSLSAGPPAPGGIGVTNATSVVLAFGETDIELINARTALVIKDMEKYQKAGYQHVDYSVFLKDGSDGSLIFNMVIWGEYEGKFTKISDPYFLLKFNLANENYYKTPNVTDDY